LHEKGHACEIEFVGRIFPGEPYARQFLQAIEKAAAAGYATYSGQKDEKALIEAFDQADGAIHFSTAESFGLVVAEALSRNLKFFGTRVGGIIDVATGVDGAELFDPDDWTGLENAIVNWLAADRPRPQAAAETMRERYHPYAIAEKHLQVYREVLSSSGPLA
jgi:glycosyltransferase involved in cell wall biosynthesis